MRHSITAFIAFMFLIFLFSVALYAENNYPSVKHWDQHAMDRFTGRSTLEIHEPTNPAAFATITFYNTEVHYADEDFYLSYEGEDFKIYFDWAYDGMRAERVTPIPPPGFIAIPEEMIVEEGQTKEIQIYRYLAG